MMNMSSSNGHQLGQTDYDLHGLVGVRLLGATARDVAAVTKQLGPIGATLTRRPDITIRFVDRLVLSSSIRYLGLDDAGFTDDGFLVLRGKHKSRVLVQIPFEQLGQPCEIVCERGIPAVPLLAPILNLTALSKGWLPLHASAFTYRGFGVLTTGWSKGGKTETLLAFAANGAKYVGDEWVYISNSGRQMVGLPEPIRVWDWHLDSLPQYRALLGRSDRVRLQGLKMMIRTLDIAMASGVGRESAPLKLMKRLARLLPGQLHVDMKPQHLFGQSGAPPAAGLDKVLFVASHASPTVTVEPMDPQEIARRMVFSLQEERADLVSYYHKFRFAFPEARNELIEQAEALERHMLQRVLAGKEAYAVYHPYPVAIPALFEAIAPLFESVAQP